MYDNRCVAINRPFIKYLVRMLLNEMKLNLQNTSRFLSRALKCIILSLFSYPDGNYETPEDIEQQGLLPGVK